MGDYPNSNFASMFIPKKILFAVGGAMVLVVGIFIGGLFKSGTEAPTTAQTAAVGDAGQTEASKNTIPEQSASGGLNGQITPSRISPSEDGERVKVGRVVDGDTIEVEINGKTESVRYIGIDTPETVDPRKPVQCFGVEASKKNKELV